MKFKVGDKVKVREWDDMIAEFGETPYGDIRCAPLIDFTPKMKEFCGREVTICSVRHSDTSPNTFRYFIKEDDGNWVWVSEMFEPTASNSSPEVINNQMDKEKQIEEIAGCVLGGSAEYRLEVAELIYSKGYRKQNQGEWIVRTGNVFGHRYFTCPFCKEEFTEHFGVMPTYCENCGAKNN